MAIVCRYTCQRFGKRCCFICDSKCRLACTKPCSLLPRTKDGRICRVRLHYSRKKGIGAASEWHGVAGMMMLKAKGPGPRNCLVQTERGLVVTPFFNLRWE